MIKTRDEYMVNYLPNGIHGAELGVFEGEFSAILNSSNKFSQLYLVDIFEGDMFSGNKHGENGKHIDLNTSYTKLLHTYENNNNVTVVKNTSVNFLNSLPDDSLSFVYIDADHSYDGVKQDLALSRFKVHANGIIAGHDYNQERFSGVYNAVNEFIKEFNLKAVFTVEDKLASYFITNSK
jgi:hypothetical protein